MLPEFIHVDCNGICSSLLSPCYFDHLFPVQIGLVAGGGRTEKPMLKAGRAHHKFAAKRNEWPKVRGVAMNPVDHPHGGGNHQHLGALRLSRQLPVAFLPFLVLRCLCSPKLGPCHRLLCFALPRLPLLAGRSGTRSRFAPPGQKVGLIAARRTGRVRGRAADKVEVE